MEKFIFNLVLLLFTYQLHDVSARRHGPRDYGDGYYDHPDYIYEDNEDDPNDLSDHCMHIRIDHETRFTDFLLCPFGCCGTLDDQKCCEDPENTKQEGHSSDNVHLIRGLLIFAGVMLIVAVTSCVFGIYKHKKAKLRKTTPARNAETRSTNVTKRAILTDAFLNKQIQRDTSSAAPAARSAPDTFFYTPRSAPYTVSYTPRNGMTSGCDSKSRPSPSKQPDRTAPVHARTVLPRYTERSEADSDVPPSSVQSPPPPYSLSTLATAPESTEIRISI